MMQILFKIVFTLPLLIIIVSIWNNQIDIDAWVNKLIPIKKADEISVSVSPLRTSRPNSIVIMDITVSNLGSTDISLNEVAVIFSPSGTSSGRAAVWDQENSIILRPHSPVRIEAHYGDEQNNIYDLSSSFSGLPFQVNLRFTLVSSQGIKYTKFLDVGRLTVKKKSGYLYKGKPDRPFLIPLRQ